ncbi:MAG: hypothetical protein EB084_01045 [Proteobacteria bacterium]|nr:hypothetical protein [Pseudomonadota bacterium]
MATGIQTGIRTGASAPLPTGKGPAGGGGGLSKVLAAWNGMSTKLKVLAGGIVAVLILGIGGYVYLSSANKPVALYQRNLTPGDVQEISAKLDQLGIPYKNEAGKIMVAPSEQSRIVGVLINYGLPHWTLQAAPEAGGMTPKTEFEKRQQASRDLEATLIDELRQVDFVADARVNLVQSDDDSLTQRPAKATVLLKLKVGQLPKKGQIQSIINLVASSVPGLQPDNVKVTDTNARVWNDGGKIASYGTTDPSATASSDDEVFSDEHLAIKKAYEKEYANKIRSALNQMMGSDKYTVAVDAEIDFNQTKIETTQVGDPSGNGQVVSVVKKDEERYTNNPDKEKGQKKSAASSGGAVQQTGMAASSNDPNSNTNYVKVKYEQKVESNKVVKTAILAPNVVSRLTASVAVDGKHDTEQKQKLAQVVAGAIGMKPERGDKVDVIDWAFTHENPVAGEISMGPEPVAVSRRDSGSNKTLMVLAMLVPTTVLLSVLTIFLLKQRRVQADRQGLVMTMGPGATTSDISDLLSDKIGRNTATTQSTRVNNTEQLEKLAKEKPTKVAELLKSTWLSDRER